MEWTVGVDIEEVTKFEKALRTNRAFFSRTFTPREIEYCMSKPKPAANFAGVFVAKEAVYKAASQLDKEVTKIDDFEIVHSKEGTPAARRTGARKRRNRRVQVKVSISHTADYAVAMALAMVDS